MLDTREVSTKNVRVTVFVFIHQRQGAFCWYLICILCIYFFHKSPRDVEIEDKMGAKFHITKIVRSVFFNSVSAGSFY